MARPSQSSALLFLTLAGGLVVFLPLCSRPDAPTVPHSASLHEVPSSGVDLSELSNIERDPIVIPDSGLTIAEGEDWIIGEDPIADASPPPASPPPAPPPPAAPSPADPSPASSTDATARYLRDVEFALLSGKYWSSPEAIAQSLIGEMTQGQTGGLSTLRESNAAVLARLQAITPPPGCEAHHRETVATVEASVQLLSSWESMLERGDLEGFASMTGQAEALKARAERVEAMTEALRRSR